MKIAQKTNISVIIRQWMTIFFIDDNFSTELRSIGVACSPKTGVSRLFDKLSL